MDKFPTEKQFNAWWVGKRDRRGGWRPESCPLARYLHSHGWPQAFVGDDKWWEDLGRGVWQLPAWARRAVERFDHAIRQ